MFAVIAIFKKFHHWQQVTSSYPHALFDKYIPAKEKA